jgi:hypothetical protein
MQSICPHFHTPAGLNMLGTVCVFACCREIEVIHARWAMLGVISILLGDVVDGASFPPQPVGGHKPMG